MQIASFLWPAPLYLIVPYYLINITSFKDKVIQNETRIFSRSAALLGAVTIWRQETVCLSVRLQQLVSNWTNFHQIWYLNIFGKPVKKVQVS
jgi:hypothetical protein